MYFQLIEAGGGRCFLFQKFEEQRELGDLYGLRVDIYAVDMLYENFPTLSQGKMQGAVIVRDALTWSHFSWVGVVPSAIVVEQEVKYTQKERAAAARNVDDAQILQLRG